MLFPAKHTAWAPMALMAAWLSSHAPAIAQSESGWPLVRTFSATEYKGHNQNWSVVQSRDGLMYFANGYGLLEYDGARWRMIPMEHALPVRSLALDADGTIYVGAKSDFGYLAPDSTGRRVFVSLKGLLDSNLHSFADVWRIHPTSEGVYFQTSRHVYRLQNGRFRSWTSSTSLHFSFHVGGRIYGRERGHGLVEFDDSGMHLVPGGEIFGEKRAMGMFPLANGQDILIVTFEGTGYLLGKEGMRGFDLRLPPKDGDWEFYSGIRLHDGSLALASLKHGLILLDADGHYVRTIDRSSGLQGSIVKWVFQDSQLGLWLAMENGLARVETASPATVFDSRNGLDGNTETILRHQGTLYVSTSSGVARMESNGRFSYVPGIEGPCFHLLSAGAYLFAASDRGLFVVRGGRATMLSNKTSYWLSRSSRDSNIVFAGTMDGLAILRRTKATWEVIPGSGIDEEIRSIVEIEPGVVWCGTKSRGVLRLQFAAWDSTPQMVRHGIEKGLPGGYGIVMEMAGVLRVLTPRGFYAMSDMLGSWIPDSAMASGISSRDIFYKNERGDLWWLSHRDDILRRLPSGGSGAGESIQRLRNQDITAAYVEDGAMWLGCPDRVLRIDQRRLKPPNPYMPVIHAEFGGRHHRMNLTSGGQLTARLPGEFHSVQFRFAYPDYDYLTGVLFQTRLEGFDVDWSEWTDEDHRTYTNLPPGRYTLAVKATAALQAQPAMQVLHFDLRPMWYRSWWIFLLEGLVLVGMLVFLVRWRFSRSIAEKARLEQLVSRRTQQLAQQKRELEKTSAELESRNRHLERITHIIRTINHETRVVDLLKSVLDELKTVRGVQKATAILYEPSRHSFVCKVSTAEDPTADQMVELGYEEAVGRYLTDQQEVADGIYVLKHLEARQGARTLASLPLPKSMLVMKITMHDRIEGFLNFDNFEDDDAFSQSDLGLLINLKEHILSAFVKVRLVEQLTLLNLKKNELIGIAAHDLRNPLNVISGYAEIGMDALRSGRFEAQQHLRDLDSIYQMSKRMARLVTELLDIAAIESGKVTLNFDREDMSEILVECEVLHRRTADLKNIRLDIRRPDGLIPVRVDRLKIAAVLDNLLSNAIKYTHAGGRVTVSCERNEHSVVTHVQDTGQGLSDEDLRRVFTTFGKLSAKPTGGETSTGLGLAIVKKIVEIHGGRVWVESRKGEGSTFSFSLPAYN